MRHYFFLDFDTLLNNDKPQDKRFRDTRFCLRHIDHVPRGLTVVPFQFVKLFKCSNEKLKINIFIIEIDFE